MESVNGRPSSNVLQGAIQSTMNGASQVLDEVEGISSQMATFDSREMCQQAESSWKQETDSIEAVLSAGRQVGILKISQMLEGGDLEPQSSIERNADELLFPNSSDDLQNGTWATAAWEQTRAVKRMVYAVPHLDS